MNYHKFIIQEAGKKITEILSDPAMSEELAHSFDPEEKMRFLQMTKGMGSKDINRYKERVKDILSTLANDKVPNVRDLAVQIIKKLDKKHKFTDMTPFSQRDYSGVPRSVELETH